MIDHRVDDAMQQRHRPFRQDVVRAGAELGNMRDAAALAVVDGDEEIRREEKIRLVRFEGVLGRLEVDAVEDDVEIAAVAFDLGLRFALHGGFDRQLVEAEHVAQDGRIRLGWFRHIRPHRDAIELARRRLGGGGQQQRRVEAVHQFGATASMDEVANQSPTFTLNAAWAAASRATGTR